MATKAILLALAVTLTATSAAAQEISAGPLTFTGWGTPQDVEGGSLRFTGWGTPQDVESGQLSFTGWGVPQDVNAGTLRFSGLGSRDEPAAVTLQFKGWGSSASPGAASLSFKGWGGSPAPTDQSLAFTGWGGGAPPAAQSLAFTGWGGGASPAAQSLDFTGWGGLGDPAAASLSFEGIATLPPPCSPETVDDGEIAASPRMGPGDHVYQHFACVTTWTQAVSECSSAGGYLVTITSPSEMEVVAGFAPDCGGAGCWIGATDQAEEGTFAWITGERWGYDNWSPGEPNDSCEGEDFAQMLPTGQWNDQMVDGGCNTWGLMGYVCEWERPDDLPWPPSSNRLAGTPAPGAR